MLFCLPTIIRIEKKKTKADMKKQPSSVVSSISSKRSKKAGEGQQKINVNWLMMDKDV